MNRKLLRRLLSSILAMSLLSIPAVATSAFPDVPENAAYADAAEYLNDVGIMKGGTNGNFNPNNTVTRAQMAAIICRMLGETENLTTDGTRFTDVPTSYWANGYIVKAAELGIINGYADGNFKPDNTVTYEQAIAMIVRSMGLNEVAEKNGGYPAGYIFVANDYGYSKQASAQKGDLLKRWQVAIILYNCVA